MESIDLRDPIYSEYLTPAGLSKDKEAVKEIIEKKVRAQRSFEDEYEKTRALYGGEPNAEELEELVRMEELIEHTIEEIEAGQRILSLELAPELKPDGSKTTVIPRASGSSPAGELRNAKATPKTEKTPNIPKIFLTRDNKFSKVRGLAAVGLAFAAAGTAFVVNRALEDDSASSCTLDNAQAEIFANRALQQFPIIEDGQAQAETTKSIDANSGGCPQEIVDDANVAATQVLEDYLEDGSTTLSTTTESPSSTTELGADIEPDLVFGCVDGEIVQGADKAEATKYFIPRELMDDAPCEVPVGAKEIVKVEPSSPTDPKTVIAIEGRSL